MRFLPISINIEDKKILIIGAGKIALQKVRSLKRFTNNITVIASDFLPEFYSENITCINKEYSEGDLFGYDLIYAATNNKSINTEIKQDAKQRKCLVNVVDDPELCDFISPAIYKQEEMTVAVSSNAENVKKSIEWRDKICELLKND